MASARPKRDRDDGGARRRGPKLANAWWREPEKHAHTSLWTTVGIIRRHSTRRREEDRHHARLYGNLDVAGAGWAPQLAGWRFTDGRMRYNLCSSAADTGQSIVAQQRPRPMYLTVEGSWEAQRQARLRTRVLEGQLHDLGMYETGPECQLDGGILGTGVVFGYLDPETKAPALEKVLPLELLVDHNDGLRRKPRSIYWRRLVDRAVLRELYPKLRKEIDEADGPGPDDKDDFWLQQDTTADQVIVIEAWHLASGQNAKDGRHVIAVSSGTLVDEEYKRKRFPFAVYRWKKRQLGFWGMGIVEECRDAQWRINQLIRKRETLSDLGSNALMMVPGESKVRVEQLTNQPLKIVRYWGGQPPQVVVNSAVPADLQDEIERIRERTFQQLGFSSQQMANEKPAGLNSGKAQRVFEDISSRRHIINGRAYEDFFMDVCDLLETLNEEAAKVNPDYRVTARTQRGRTTLLSQVKWADVALAENKYRMQMWPTSALPSTPAGKWAAVQEWVDSGFVSRPFAQQLLDFPDLDAAVRIELADLDAVMHDVERILDGEQGVLPDGYQNLEMAADVARRSLLQARILGAPDDVLLALTDYVDEAMRLVSEAAAAAAPPPQAGMVPPAGPTGPVPPDAMLAAPPAAMGPGGPMMA